MLLRMFVVGVVVPGVVGIVVLVAAVLVVVLVVAFGAPNLLAVVQPDLLSNPLSPSPLLQAFPVAAVPCVWYIVRTRAWYKGTVL